MWRKFFVNVFISTACLLECKCCCARVREMLLFTRFIFFFVCLTESIPSVPSGQVGNTLLFRGNLAIDHISN